MMAGQPLSVNATILDTWANDASGPVALHIRQKLVPVEDTGDGTPCVVFPPTYADIRYCIDTLSDGTKVAQIDSVGSQANRMEPLFKKSRNGQPANPLADMVPQIEIAIGNNKAVSILDAGHRLGDALVRSTELATKAREAFAAYLERGHADLIAKLAPTSLVFGVWDSRDTQAKLPRIVQSVIRAWDVDEIRRAAQYNPPVDYAVLEVFGEEEKKKAEGNSKNPLAQRGFVHVPNIGPGGVVVRGEIRRDVTVNLVALRQLDGENGSALRSYILGLSLVAAMEPQEHFLRQGCHLVPASADYGPQIVHRSGGRESVVISLQTAHDYARKAGNAFGKGKDLSVTFDKALAKADVTKDDGGKKVKGS